MNPSAGIVGQQAARSAGERWLAGGADLISYGRANLANPTLSNAAARGCLFRTVSTCNRGPAAIAAFVAPSAAANRVGARITA